MAFLTSSVHAGHFDLDKLTDPTKIRPAGQKYEANVPDTLDLAERANLLINNLTQCPWDIVVSPETLKARLNDPPYINVKQLRTLPKLRAMCGSDQLLDEECAAMRTQLKPVIEAAEKGDDKTLGAFRRMAVAIVNWYHRDGNPQWLELLKLLSDGVQKTIIQVEDRAYFPTDKEENQFIPYNPPDEPPIDQIGREGTVRWDQSWGLRALVRNYHFNGDKSALKMADKIKRFLLKPKMWEDTGSLNPPGYEHGIWAGHYHGSLTGLAALLDLAIAEDDEGLRQLIRDAYDHARQAGAPRIGWFPMWFPAGAYNRPKENSSYCESCGIADLTVLAVRLTDAGLGDYWDDVDYYVRNQLAEQQFTDLNRLREIAGKNAEFDPMLKRLLGGFGLSDPTINGYVFTKYQPQVVSGCCSPNAGIALYYTWHGITRFTDGVATVNLLLNRASPWMDINSYLPYEGKVILHNKQAHAALVRIPGWIKPDTVKSTLNGTAVKKPVTGRCLLFQSLKPGDTIELRFAVPEFHDQYTLYDTKYSVHFRGSTVVDIAPRKASSSQYALYLRESMKSGKTPMRTVQRFVADKLIPLP